MRSAVVCFGICVLASAAVASEPPVDVAKQARGARTIVVGRVIDVQSTFDVSAHGDQLIVSHARIEVEETLKGAAAPSIDVVLEGGTVGDLTLEVSDMPKLRRGERAVMFLDSASTGSHVPHRRGHGILKLDSADRVRGRNASLADVREAVQKALR